jgi:hypothetical protein
MLRRFSHLAIAAIVVGCTEPTSAFVAGVYVLRTVGGDPVPTNTVTERNEVVVADTIVALSQVSSRGFAQVEHRAVYRNPDGSLRAATYLAEYRRDSNRLTFLAPPCPNPEYTDCFFVGRTGLVDGTHLTITFSDPAFREQVFVQVR